MRRILVALLFLLLLAGCANPYAEVIAPMRHQPDYYRGHFQRAAVCYYEGLRSYGYPHDEAVVLTHQKMARIMSHMKPEDYQRFIGLKYNWEE